MHTNKYPVTPYNKWPHDEFARWVRVGNNFGAHLIEGVRDEAVRAACNKGVPSDQAEKVVDLTMATFMAFLDGVIGYRDIDERHTMEYVLQAKVIDKSVGSTNEKVVETFELAPEGDGLGMGLAGWLQGDFGQGRDKQPEA